MIDRSLEESIIDKMSKKGLCARILESDQKTYRIEEFLDEYTNPDPNSKFSYSKEFLDSLSNLILEFNFSFSYSKKSKTVLTFLNTLYKENSKKISDVKSDSFKPFKSFLKVFQSRFLLTAFFPSNQQLVMTHNDIHLGNILVNRQNVFDMKLIDYEYANFSYIGFDFVNYLVEGFFDLGYFEYPFYKVNKNIEELFRDSSYFQLYQNFTNKLDLKLIPKISLEYIQSEEYYHKLLCLSSVLWSLVAILNINFQDDKSSFDYQGYAKERLKIFEYFLVKVEGSDGFLTSH